MSALIPARVDALLARCRREIDEGRIPGCQVAVGFEGEVVLFEALGEVTTEQRFHLYSAVKPSVSLTVLEIAAEGLFGLDAPVASILPSFAGNGKDAITVSQVLLHAGGFPHAPLGAELFSDREARLNRYSTWRITWEPGTRYEYHASSAHWVLADVIQEVTGRHHVDVIDERLMAPAGVGRWLGIGEDDQRDIVDVVSVGSSPDPAVYKEKFGIDLPATEVTDDALLAFNDPGIRATGHPGGGGIAGAADVALWYQAILHDDGEILRPEVKVDALTTVRQTHRDWLDCPAERTHAFTLGGDDGLTVLRGFGHTNGPHTFGHGGAKGQRGWADPDTGISLGFVTHGLDRDEIVHAHRGAAISTKAGELTTPVG